MRYNTNIVRKKIVLSLKYAHLIILIPYVAKQKK